MQQYLDLLSDVLENGKDRMDRTGTGTLAVFGRQMRFDLNAGFPLLTTKRIPFRHVVAELLWFISGSTNIRPLIQQGVHIWTAWPLQAFNRHREAIGQPPYSAEEFERAIIADARFSEEWGDLGPIYGEAWRAWEGPEGIGPVDQLARVIDGLKTDPYSRRHIISAWNVGLLDEMLLPPCHAFVQFLVDPDGKLSCTLTQRSCDVFLGVGWNIACYSLLTKMIAQVCGLGVGEFIWTGNDVHVYANHVEQAREQLTREPRPLPTVTLDPSITDIDDFRAEHVLLAGYDPWPTIKAEVAV